MKRLLLLTFVLLAGGSALAQGNYRAEVYYRDGARLTLEGRLAEAAAAFEQAVALDPGNGNAYYSLGNVYAEMGRWADAVGAYQRAVGLNKEDVEAYNNLGVALAARGDYARAEAALARAVKIYPKWAEPYFHLSRVRHALGDEEGAREAYERALRLRPDYATNPPARFQSASAAKPETPAQGGGVLRAMNALNLGGANADGDTKAGNATGPKLVGPKAPGATRTEAAGANASKPRAVEANTSRRSAADSNAGRSAASDASTADSAPAAPAARPAPPRAATNRPAAPAADGAAATEPPDARSYYELGVREERAGRHNEAIAALRQAVLLDRKNAAAYVVLGDAYAATGSWPESVDAYEQAARLNPDDAETYEKLGRSFAKLREVRAPRGGAGGVATATRANGVAAEDDADPTAVYRVGPGDVLDVRVLKRGAGAATTAYEVAPGKGYEVTPTGLLAYPTLAEPLKVAGLTTDQIAARLGERLGLRAGGAAPEIAVGVRDYASHAIIVSGMVKEAGTKILQREGVPLYVIIAYAQPQPGAGQALVVSRVTGRTTAVDLSDAGATRMLVRPGDVITVTARPEQFVYVSGAVRQPGQKRFNAGLTLTQAVLAAGGALSSQGASFVTVTRQGEDGRLASTRYALSDIKAGKTPDPPLRPGDRVEVLKQ